MRKYCWSAKTHRGLNVNSIPRNWLLGSNGKWFWDQIGFDSGEADWGKSMLARVDELK